MNKEQEPFCNEDMDRFNHYLIEQITKISVQEEEERMKEEITQHNEEQ